MPDLLYAKRIFNSKCSFKVQNVSKVCKMYGKISYSHPSKECTTAYVTRPLFSISRAARETPRLIVRPLPALLVGRRLATSITHFPKIK